MIIKSKYNYSSLYIMIFVAMFVVIGGGIYGFSNVTSFHPIMLFYIFCIVMVLVLDLSTLYWDTNLLTIDTDKKTILFGNILNKKEIAYLFDEIGSVFERRQAWGGGYGYHKVLYLVKDNAIIERISAASVDNYEDLKAVFKSKQIDRFVDNNQGKRKNIAFYIKKIIREF